MQNQPKYTRTVERKILDKFVFDSGMPNHDGGYIAFFQADEYRDYNDGKGPVFHKTDYVKNDERMYTDIGRNYFIYETREAYMRARRYAKKLQTLN